MRDDDMTDTLLAFFENQRMMETADYLGRGRAFGRWPTGRLRGRWVRVCRAAFAADGDPGDRELSDLCAEFGLRGLELPLHHVEAEVAAATERAAAARAIRKAEGRRLVPDDDPLMVFLRELDAPRGAAN